MHNRFPIYAFPALLCLLLTAGVFVARADDFMPLTNGPVPPFQDILLDSDARNYTVHYPAVGVKPVDEIIADWAAGLIADAPAEAVVTGDDGKRYALYELQARYSLSAAAPRYFSVVFFTTQTILERRENIIYTLNFDLQAHKAVGLKDIFLSPDKALPRLPDLIIKAAAGVTGQDGEPVNLPYYVDHYSDYKDEFARFLTLAFCPEGLNVYLSASDVVLLHKEDLIKIGAKAALW